jgi:integrase
MTRIRLSYVNAFRDRHGKLRHVFRRRGFKKVSLPGQPGSEEFMAAYQAAFAGVEAKLEIVAGRTTPGTVNAAIVDYYTSTTFQELSAGSKKQIRSILERFRNAHSDKRLHLLERQHIVKLLGELRPHARTNWLSALRGLLAFAVTQGFIKENPAIGIKFKKRKTEGHRPWTDEEIAQYEATYPIGTKARLALALPLYTALRKSDFLRVGPQHICDGVLRVTQQKTGEALQLPIRPELQEIIAATPCDHMTFLVSSTGGPYSPNGFAEQFRRWCDEAGLPKDCRVHGLRGTCATRLAHDGATPPQIMAWTGHKSLSQVQRYSRAANQLRMARKAIEQSDNRGVTNLLRKSD